MHPLDDIDLNLDSTTLPPSSSSMPGSHRAETETLGLALLWSRDEPGRVGELLLLPTHDLKPWAFGRAVPEDQRRLDLVRARGGALIPTAPIHCPRISRNQLRLSATATGTLLVENIGSCPMFVAGILHTRAELAPGECLSLQNELSFLCVRRTLSAVPPSENPALVPSAFGRADAFGLVGESEAIWALRRQIATLARHSLHVLILGESGCGKELVSQAIHELSARGKKPIVSRNAVTIPEGLADAELFGNVRNYPNAGMPERPGLIGQAHESSLFLDEFAELPLTLQTHLLRVMDSGEYQRLGEATTRTADLRVIAATNRPAQDIKQDVLARFKVKLTVPDLNARREDIPLLLAHLLRGHARSDAAIARQFFTDGDLELSPRISPQLVEALVGHRYTTHVRELDAFLLRAMLESKGKYVDLQRDLKAALDARPPPRREHFAGLEALTNEERTRLGLLRHHSFRPTACGQDPAYPGNRQTADLHFRHLLCRVLHIADWSPERAAELLAGGHDVSTRALYEKSLARIGTFLDNIRARLDGDSEQQLRRSLSEEWKSNAPAVLLLLDALRAGQIPSR